MDALPAEALAARAERVAERVALRADAKLLPILCHLAKGGRPVGAIQAALELGQSAPSQHLARLREAGVVAARREGRTIHDRLADPGMEAPTGRFHETFRRGASARLWSLLLEGVGH